MSTHESLDMLYERAKGKLTLRDWEMIFNAVCKSITGRPDFFGSISRSERDDQKMFTFEEAVERSLTVVDNGIPQSVAKSRTIIELKEKLGRMSADEAASARIDIDNSTTTLLNLRKSNRNN